MTVPTFLDGIGGMCPQSITQFICKTFADENEMSKTAGNEMRWNIDN